MDWDNEEPSSHDNDLRLSCHFSLFYKWTVNIINY